MTYFKRFQKAFAEIINGGKDPAAIYQLEQQLMNAHMNALMKTKEYRNDGF